jgi:hypothetical protein
LDKYRVGRRTLSRAANGSFRPKADTKVLPSLLVVAPRLICHFGCFNSRISRELTETLSEVRITANLFSHALKSFGLRKPIRS